MTATSQAPSHASEAHVQFAAATINDELGLHWFHPPNEALGDLEGGSGPRSRRPRTREEQLRMLRATQLVGQGVKTGVVDVIIEDTPPAFPNAPGARCELKTVIGSASPDQVRWLSYYKARGFYVGLCKGTQAYLRWLRAGGWDPDAALARLEARGWQFDGERLRLPPSKGR